MWVVRHVLVSIPACTMAQLSGWHQRRLTIHIHLCCVRASCQAGPPPYLLKPLCVKSDTRPTLSPLPYGAYGTPSRCSGTVVGPHPSSFSIMPGTSKPAGMLGYTESDQIRRFLCSPRNVAHQRCALLECSACFTDPLLQVTGFCGCFEAAWKPPAISSVIVT